MTLVQAIVAEEGFYVNGTRPRRNNDPRRPRMGAFRRAPRIDPP